MPFIRLTTSKTLTHEQKLALKAGFGRDISILPTKTEAGLMVSIEDGCSMFYGGEEKECAFLDLRLYKASPLEEKKLFVLACYALLREIAGLDEQNVYMNIIEQENWASCGALK